MARIVLENITRRFGTNVAAVNDISLEIEDGEFMVLVGPSGCGKTTLLRIVAGLESVTAGEVYIDGQQVTDLPPKQRDIAMVFQNYALYPHITVERNVGFGLKLRGVPKQEIRTRVLAAARILGLEDLLDRKPAQLSGGQRQRVAMGRAMVREPRAFLMDEPLSNLDAKLRVQMRAELGRLRERLRTTTIYVTHDQVEAMTLGDRVAVLRDGVIQQVDTPSRLYRHPSNIFVAAFIGSPSMNLVQAEIRDGRALFGGYSVPIITEAAALLDGRTVILGIRPTDFEDADLAHAEGPAVIEATAEVVEDLGSETHVLFSVAAPPVMSEAATAARSLADEGAAIAPLLQEATSSFTACIDSRTQTRPGRPVRLTMDPARFHFFDPDTGASLTVPDRVAAAT